MSSFGNTVLKSVLSVVMVLAAPMAFASKTVFPNFGRCGCGGAARTHQRNPSVFLLRRRRRSGDWLQREYARAHGERHQKRSRRFGQSNDWAQTFNIRRTSSIKPSTQELHIQGMRDPFFDRDRLFALLADLNLKKVKNIKRLTFDSNFLVLARRD